MSVFEILVLSIVQGLTEFLPVSSKTHLLFAQKLMGMQPDLHLTIVLHAGSLAAILLYYWRGWWALLRERRAELPRLVLATIPAVAAALLFKRHLVDLYGKPVLGSALLLVTATWLVLADRLGRERWGILEAPLGRVFLVGLAQAFALLPGISRSGSTIGAGYLAGLKRDDAVRFSFFMGAVAIAGALLLDAKDLVRAQVRPSLWTISIGIAATFAVSLAAIKVVEKLSGRGRFGWFALYCAAAGVLGLLYFGFSGRG